jgi:hypothetical protein
MQQLYNYHNWSYSESSVSSTKLGTQSCLGGVIDVKAKILLEKAYQWGGAPAPL